MKNFIEISDSEEEQVDKINEKTTARGILFVS